MPRFIAIDWDQNQLHVVAADVRSGTIKVQRAFVWQEEQSPNLAEADALGKLLRERLSEAGIPPAPLLVCIGRDRVIVKDIRHPPVPDAEEPGLVRFQAVKELTEPPDEVVIDYVPVGDRREPGERRAQALIVRRDIVATWKKIALVAGLKLEGITPRPFGIAECLRRVMGTTALTPPPSPPDSAVAAAVIGERWAGFVVQRGDTLLLARTLAVGAGVASEIRRNLAIYGGQGEPPVTALYLTGNVTPELRQRLGDMLPDLPLHPFDPFVAVELPEVAPIARGCFAGAVGLLYAKATRAGLPINFVQPRQPKPPANNRKQLILGGFLAFVIVVGGGGYLSAQLNDHQRRSIDAATHAREETEAKLTKLKEENKRNQAVDEWESPDILDELYDLADRIDEDHGKLRITKLEVALVSHSGKTASRYAGKLIVTGILLDSRGGGDRGAGGFGAAAERGGERNTVDKSKPVEDLIAKFMKDEYYSVEAPRITNGNQFTLTINVERRPPEKWVRKIKDAF